LASLDIKPKHDDKWRALRDLSEEERKRLCSALADYLLSKGLRYEISDLIGHIYTLNCEEDWTPLRDAREFAVLLNATGRMNRPGLGVSICMGDRTAALEEAEKVLNESIGELSTSILAGLWKNPKERKNLKTSTWFAAKTL